MDVESMRLQLVAARRLGLSFDQAWSSMSRQLLACAQQEVERSQTLTILNATRSAWERAYKREAPTRAEWAAYRLMEQDGVRASDHAD